MLWIVKLTALNQVKIRSLYITNSRIFFIFLSLLKLAHSKWFRFFYCIQLRVIAVGSTLKMSQSEPKIEWVKGVHFVWVQMRLSMSVMMVEASSSLGRFFLLGIDLDIVSHYCSYRWLHNLRCRGLPSETTDCQPSLSGMWEALCERRKSEKAPCLPSGNQPTRHESQDVALFCMPSRFHTRKW